jgi:deoxyhypusine synthase
MFVSMAGAMSTAEIGVSLAEMIRRDKVHGICCTGANLEEDIFNLVAHSKYVRLANYRDLTPAEETTLYNKHLNRVTDVAIPEKAAMTPIEGAILRRWQRADKSGESFFPHEFLYDLLRSGEIADKYDADPRNSWMIAACESNLPIYVPGWEDSTLGQVYAATCQSGEIKNVHTVKGGIQYMVDLMGWYSNVSKYSPLGFFQIGGGIAGDFSICVVPVLKEDADPPQDVPMWKYFCQVSESYTSYGGYSGAMPNEKITWGKLTKDTPRFVIESDASIVVPLIFAYVLGW